MVLSSSAEIYRRFKQAEQIIDWFDPLEYQREAYLCSAKYQLFEGGNRSGKTETSAVKVIQIARGKHPTIKRTPPQKIRVVGTTLTEGALDVIFGKISKFIPLTELKGGAWKTGYNREKRKIFFRNGSFIQLMADTQEIDNFRGADLDVLWVDEECSEEVFDECVTRLADRNGLAIISMTPHKGFTWTYKRLVRPAQFSPDIRHFIFRTIDNYHINRVEFVKSAALMSDREFQIRIKGKRIANEGLVYSMFDEKVHVVRPFNMDAFDHEGKKPQLFIGVDFGLNNPTGASIWGVMPNKKRYIMDEYYQEGFTVKQNAENLADKMKKYNLKLRWITVDPNDGAKRSEQTNERNVDVFKKNFCRAYGKQVPVFMGNRGVGVIEHRIDKMNEMLSVINGEPNLQVFSNCLNHIDEFSSYAFPNRKNEELNRYEKPKEYKNHLMNAAEYVAERNPHVAATQDFSIVNRMYNYDPTGLVRC